MVIINENPHPAYRPDIDGLRAIAVLSVIGFHVAFNRVSGGFVGVDIFFVISGYLISSIIFKGLETGKFNLAAFYGSRIRRIFPSLVVVLITAWLVGWFFYLPDYYRQLGKYIFSGAGFISNLVSWQDSGYFAQIESGPLKPLLHLWSLGIEEQFYIVWPLMVAVAWKIWKKGSNLIWLLIPIFVCSLTLNIYWVHSAPEAAFYLPFPRFWELVMGSGLAYTSLCKKQQVNTFLNRIFDHSEMVFIRNGVAIIGLLFIIGSIFGLDKDKSFPGWWALLPTIGTLLVISAGKEAWINKNVLSNHGLVFIGLISYPLYLWHWLLLSFAREVYYFDGIDRRLLSILAICVAILLSYALYTFVERPIRKGILLKHKNLTTPILTGLMILVGVAGFLTYQSNGFKGRVPEEVYKLLVKYNYFPEFRNGKCLLYGNQTEFSPECVEIKNSEMNFPLTMIWGDSHGAHLYRAIKELQHNHDFSLAQFTSSGCPPIFDFDLHKMPLCRTINDDIRKRILQLKPTTIILAHDWPQTLDQNALAGLGKTIGILRHSEVKKIIMIGPVPHWYKSLPWALFRYTQSHQFAAIPSRMKSGLIENIEQLDIDMEKLAKNHGIDYISPYKTFCNSDGCLTTVGENEKHLTSFDIAHLTLDGARFFIKNIEFQLF